MLFDESDPSARYLVLINHEEQYSLWPAWKPVPKGWSSEFEGPLQECRQYVTEHWTDMRPASLRKSMAASN